MEIKLTLYSTLSCNKSHQVQMVLYKHFTKTSKKPTLCITHCSDDLKTVYFIEITYNYVS